MKRYNQVRNGSYEPRSEMVEERDGDWVWWEDVETQCAKLESKCAELETKCAELLEAATNALWWWDSGNKISPKPSDIIGRLRSAIAKAKGEVMP